eukprot:12624363-Heterocapsa_arctica.AAC.1
MADATKRGWEHRLALGGWREAPMSAGQEGPAEKRNQMPVRYSGRREEAEVEAKLSQALWLSDL